MQFRQQMIAYYYAVTNATVHNSQQSTVMLDILGSVANSANNVEQKFRVLRRRTQACSRKSRTTTKTHRIYADRICAVCNRARV